MIIFIDFGIHAAFYLYALIEVISYIFIHKYPEDIVILGVGGTVFLLYAVNQTYF